MKDDAQVGRRRRRGRNTLRALLAAMALAMLGATTPASGATVMLDSFESPSDGAAGPVSTAGFTLTSGQQYSVQAQGTWRAYNQSLMQGTTPGWVVCGTTEPNPIFPSGGGPIVTAFVASTNPVGQDAEFVFARPQRKRCDPNVTLPRRYKVTNPALEFNTGDGSGFHHVTPDGGAPTSPTSNHTYTYTVTGAGAVLQARIVDTNTTDNSGQLQLTVTAK